MSNGGYNLWLESVRGTETESPEEGIARVFRVSPERARVLLRRVPCTVKRNVSREEAVRVGEALISIGGLVRLDRADGTAAGAARPPREPATQPSPAAVSSAPPSSPTAAPARTETTETVKLGTMELGDALRARTPDAPLTLSWGPLSDPAPAQPSSPRGEPPAPDASSPFEPLDIEPSLQPQPSEPQAHSYRSRFEPLELGPPAPDSALALQAADLLPQLQGRAFEAEHPLQRQVSSALALPASDRPPPPHAWRAPNERRTAPIPRGAWPTGSGSKPKPRLSPLAVVNELLRTAEQSSWRAALQGHPVAGFVLVLGTATSAALVLYALL